VRHVISRERFRDLTRPLAGLPVSRAWRGAGSAIVLELGALEKRYERTGKPKGEAALIIDWSWRVEGARSVPFGSWSGDRKIANGLRSLVGRTVLDLQVTGRLPELSVTLSGNRWLQSFMTAEGQPAWSVFLQDESWLCVERGVLVHDEQNARPAALA
jgi:hypothetical protein